MLASRLHAAIRTVAGHAPPAAVHHPRSTLHHPPAILLAMTMLAAGLIAARGEPPADAPAGRDVIRDGFETPRPSWQEEYTDTTVRLLSHDRSDRAAHGGRTSERFQFEAGPGSRFFVSEALPNIPVTEDLGISLYVRSNRPGAQLFGWVVLPADIDPETQAPSFLLVPGTSFNRPDRWEKLELADMLPAIEEQARVLRASSRRPVSTKGAYLGRVVVNLLGGQGQTDVFLDDLQVGPVPRALAAAWAAGRSPTPRPETSTRGQARKAGAPKESDEPGLPPIQLSRGVFERLVAGQRYVPWFPVAIDAPGADPVVLRRHGFDVLVTDANPDVRKIRPLLEGDRPMFLLPRLSTPSESGDAHRVLQEMAEYPLPRSVALWSLGEHLGRQREVAARMSEVERIREVLAAINESEERHLPTTAIVDGEFRLFSRSPANLDVIGVEVANWGRTQPYTDGLWYLKQRRDITARTNLEALFWAWLPVTTPPDVVRNIWGTDDVPPWGTPPVQPEQLRLMTYMALAGGCRGITFLGDADLTRPAGEPLLIEMGFLNAEIDLFEAILAGNVRRISEYAVYDPDPPDRPNMPNTNQKRMPLVKEPDGKPGLYAATIPLAGAKGALLLVADFNGEAQWQPGQLAYRDLTIYARLPQAVQFLEVSPGEARFLEQRVDDRDARGMRITIPEFDVTSMILCTTDIALCERIQRNVMTIRPMATQWAIRQADLQLALAREGHERLKARGHLLNNKDDLELRRLRGIEGRPTDADNLIAQAEDAIKLARKAYEDQDYATAWAQARRATRPIRLVMSGYWGQGMTELRKAVEESINGKKVEYPKGAVQPYPRPPVLVNAASCPPAISFYTLPQMHIWKNWIQGLVGYRFGPNRVPSGSFDDQDAIQSGGWRDVSHQYENVVKRIDVEKRKPGPWSDPKEIAKKRASPGLKKKPDIVYEKDVVAENDHVLKLSVRSADPDPKKIDELDPYLDEPAAAVLSPAVRVAANNLIRISVLVQFPTPTPPGKGGVIVRDTIGGEQFQFRSSGDIPRASRVVLYRKAPTDGNLRVLLGLAGFGEVIFDDFRVEIVEEGSRDDRPVDPGLVQQPRPDGTRPILPDPRVPAAAALPSATRRER